MIGLVWEGRRPRGPDSLLLTGEDGGAAVSPKCGPAA